jgi:hypothetical protein
MPDIKLFAGNATPELAKKISERLYISLGDATVGRFSDGEIQVQINENVRGADVFIIQSTCAPTNDNLMELIVMVDALRRASAEPKALIGFAGPRVIEQTVREKLPEGFQRSEFLLEKGAIDMIVKRSEMRSTLGNLLSKLTNQPSPFVEVEVVENA